MTTRRKKARTKADPTQLFQLKITLEGSKPPIWRRLQVPDTLTLGDLHEAIQLAMGWTNSHLHQFIIKNIFYSDPEFQLGWDPGEVENEHGVTLADLGLKAKSKFLYEYDFGDSWEHRIEVEKQLPFEGQPVHPICLKGQLACPPDDCGGIWGFYDMLEVIKDPQHEEHEEMLEWLGDNFDPNAFDVDIINQHLKEVPGVLPSW